MSTHDDKVTTTMATIKKTKASTTHAQTDSAPPKGAARGVRRTKTAEVPSEAAPDEAAAESNGEAQKGKRRVRKSEAPVEAAPTEGVSKRKRGTTANELAKKVQVAAEAKKAPKAAKTKPGSIVIVRRQKTAIDDVASTLLGMTTIEEMLEYAETVGDIAEKKTKNMTNLRRAAAGGTHTGLLRMRVGNLIRGALNRQAKVAAIEQTGKSARGKKK